MIRILFLFLLSFFASSCASEHEDPWNFYLGNRESEIFKDLLDKNVFAPPYKDYKLLTKLAEKCSDFFMSDQMADAYLRTLAREEYLGLAAGMDSLLLGLIKNSGGVVAMSDYMTGDVLYLAEVSNREHARKSAEVLFFENTNSPQHKKAENHVKSSWLNKDSIEFKNKKAHAFLICLRVDAIYTSLGGVKYSRTSDILKSVKRQVHLKVTNDMIGFISSP
ncbi:hypothetical protein P0F32_003686 [Vibrio metschnikovii]|nr:hypothetical protein [Vibrio metschnikovii]